MNALSGISHALPSGILHLPPHYLSSQVVVLSELKSIPESEEEEGPPSPLASYKGADQGGEKPPAPAPAKPALPPQTRPLQQHPPQEPQPPPSSSNPSPSSSSFPPSSSSPATSSPSSSRAGTRMRLRTMGHSTSMGTTICTILTSSPATSSPSSSRAGTRLPLRSMGYSTGTGTTICTILTSSHHHPLTIRIMYRTTSSRAQCRTPSTCSSTSRLHHNTTRSRLPTSIPSLPISQADLQTHLTRRCSCNSPWPRTLALLVQHSILVMLWCALKHPKRPGFSSSWTAQKGRRRARSNANSYSQAWRHLIPRWSRCHLSPIIITRRRRHT